MKKIIICFMLCISLILTGCGSLLSNDSVPINTTAEIDDTDKIADEKSIDVTKDKISVKRSYDSNFGTFVLKNGTLFGAKFKNELFPNSLIDKDNVKQLTNVAEFDYRETVWNDYFDRDDYTAMVYAMKKDNTFWMRGFALKKSLPKQAKHNYKEWTQIAENVKSFYAKDDPAVYIIKKDKSLWFWRKDGFYWDGKWHYDFIKIMENVKGVITDGYGYIDCVQKTDNSLWMINLKNPNESKNKFQWKNPFISVGLEDDYPYPVYPYRTMPYKVLDNVVLCKSIAVGVDQTWYAVDKDNVAWTWGFQHFGKERFLSYPLRLTENVKEIKVDTCGWAQSCVTFIKKDGSLWIQYDSGDPVYKVANNVKKAFPISIGINYVYVLTKRNVLKEYYIRRKNKNMNLKNSKKKGQISISKKTFGEGVEDFLYDDERGALMLRNDGRLYNKKGKVIMEDVSGIYHYKDSMLNSVLISGSDVYAPTNFSGSKNPIKFLFSME